MGVPGKTEGTIFSPIPVEIIYSENEKVGGKNLGTFKLFPIWHTNVLY